MKHNTLSLITATLLITTLSAEETLREITVVSTNKTTQSIQNTTSNVTIISSEDIEENGYLTVSQAINTVAGLSVANAGGIGQQTSFFMRGADSGKVLVLLDGMRLNDPSTTSGTALLESLTTESIERIEILKGGASSIWGSNASAGVINIITKKSHSDGLHGSIGARYGTYVTKGLDTTLSYKNQKFHALFIGQYLDTDSISSLAPTDAEKDAYSNKNYTLKMGYTIDEHNQIDLHYHRIDTDTNYDDPFSSDGADDSYSHAKSKQKNIALHYSFNLNNYHVDFYASKGKNERQYFTTGMYGDGHNVYKATLKEYTWINALAYTNGKVIAGFEYKDIDGFNQYNTYTPSQADYSSRSAYVSNTYHVTPTTLLETNLRYDNYHEFKNKTTYKVGVKHGHPSLPGFETSANYYTAYDAPSSYQFANAVSGTLLTPSYTKGYDITMAYKKLLSLTYFNNRVEDNIDYDMTNYGYYNVTGTSKFSGLEAESIVPLGDLFTLTANYTHLFKYKKEDGTQLDRRAKDTLNLALDAYTEDDTHYGITAQYVGDREESGHSTGNYTLWNLNYNTKIMDTVDVSIHAKNIFDKDYQSVYGYATPGRTLDVKVKYTF